MKKTISVLLALIISLSLIATITSCAKKEEEPKTKDIQYVLYVGTNDKDTVEPVFTPEESKAKAIEILLKRFGGYTIQEANGGWVDNGKIYTEYTLVIYLSDTTLDKVHAACNEFIEVFHQSSILIQSNETTTEFYAGANS